MIYANVYQAKLFFFFIPGVTILKSQIPKLSSTKIQVDAHKFLLQWLI